MERWFGLLTARQIKRGSHAKVASLVQAIEDFITTHNDDPKPPRWQRTADEILTAIPRFAARTVKAHS